MRKEPSFIQLHHALLRQRFTLSRAEFVGTEREKVEITILDKVLFAYMKSRYEYFSKKKGYFDSYQQIADAVGVDKKTVARFVQKWKTHGYVDYFNGGGNRINYTKFDSIFTDNVGCGDEIPEHIRVVPSDTGECVPDFSVPDYEYERSIGLI